MSVVYLTRQQLDSIIEFAKNHPFNVTLEEGALGESYVTATLMDAEGNMVDSCTWTWTGQALPPEALPPD